MAKQEQLQKKPSTTVSEPQNSSEFLQTRPFATSEQTTQPNLQAKSDTNPAGTARQNKDGSQGHRTSDFGHSFGNLAVSPCTNSVQPKLTIGQPGDKYEQEADRVAADVVQRINQPQAVSPKQQETVQRQEVPEEEELQMKPLANSVQRMEVPEEEELQMKPLANSVQRMEVPEEEELQMKPLANSIQRQEVPEEEELQMKPLANSVQRMEVPEEEELQMKPLANSIQRQEVPEEEELQTKSLLQRQTNNENQTAPDSLETSINQARGDGQSLGDVQGSMEQAFGANFSEVRVHTDAKADQLNQTIQARAFTTGQDIFFRDGEYNPASRNGQELLAHELTHVVQQQPQMVQMDKDAVEPDKGVNPPPEKKDISWIYDTLKQLKSWNAVKDKFISDEPTMRQLVEFRKTYVDSKINELRQKYPTLIAKSVGSKDLSSDYDITISTPGTGEDVEAVDEFNNAIKAEFGVQPGTLFDTNLYAKDFLKVEGNIKPDIEQQQQEDSDLAQPENQNLGKLTDLDQDVAALVKQRRFMNQGEWDKYTQSVVSGIADKKQKQAVLKQYEEADAIFQISAHELLEETKKDEKVHQEKGQLGKEENDELSQIKDGKVREQVEKQLLGIEELHLITHENPDLVLEKSNQLYIDRMRQVRVLQCLIQNPEEENVDVMKAEVKKLLGEACFFAAEAYHSEGAVKHVVAGLQGDNAQEALKKLTPENILQSYNEQLGDFLKDIVHYTQEKADPGKVFYRSSKYLYRLFDAIKEIKKRPEFADIQLTIGDENFFAAIIESGLLAIRKGNLKFASEVETNLASVDIVKQSFGVDTSEGLKQKVLQMSVEFNQKVRNKLSFLTDKNAETEYFQNAQRR